LNFRLGIKIVRTRLIVSLAMLFLVRVTTPSGTTTQVFLVILAYIGLILLVASASAAGIPQQKRVRALRDVVDVAAISIIVTMTGRLESPWFLLYLFPVMSASRYLGPAWSVAIAASSALGYAIAIGIWMPAGAVTISSFSLRAITLVAVALTATNLARLRDRGEATLLSAIERIDREIGSNADVEQVMRSVLHTVMEITDSDLSAIVLVDGATASTSLGASRSHADGSQDTLGADVDAAQAIVIRHHAKVITSRAPLALPERGLLGAAAALLQSHRPLASWPARLVPLAVNQTQVGVLGVFSRRIPHFTRDDVRSLLSVAPLLAIAQKNTTLYRELKARDQESKARLQVLFDIGEQLKGDLGLDQVFNNIVRLVSDRICCEEAALFVPVDKGARLQKVAVSAPDDESTRRLAEIELYESEGSLTRQVFTSKRPLRNNDVPSDEVYAQDYAKRLPSATARHYMGVPLLIGPEIYGVIRVLNKKAAGYASEPSHACLAADGFSPDDLDLLTIIAAQVAAALYHAGQLRDEKLAAIGRIAHITGHDIKNHIATIQNYVAFLEHSEHVDSDTAITLSAIRDVVNDTLSKLQTLLMTAKSTPPRKSVLSLKALLGDFAAKIAKRLAAAHIDFLARYPDSDGLTLADSEQIQQVLATLFANSLDAIRSRNANGHPPGRIEVALEEDADSLRLSWRDNGCGMSPAERAKAFSAFFTTKKETGSGLGLYISKGIVENHDGCITVESVAPSGVCFRITLPIYRPSS
jgi:nitrogen-specific signal transduction histidine kinase